MPADKTTSKTSVVRDIRRVANELGHAPTEPEYNRHGEHTGSVAELRFGTYNEAVMAAGLEPQNPRAKRYSDAELLLDLVRVARELDKPPSTNEYNEHGRHDESLYRRRFDVPWSSLKLQAYDMANDERRGEGAEYGKPLGPETGPMAETEE